MRGGKAAPAEMPRTEIYTDGSPAELPSRNGVAGEGRTHTKQILSLPPLPIGLRPQRGSGSWNRTTIN